MRAPPSSRVGEYDDKSIVMKLLYSATNTDLAALVLVKTALDGARIGYEVRNESRPDPPPNLCPEVWVVEDSEYPRACELRDSVTKLSPTPPASLTCPSCGQQFKGYLGPRVEHEPCVADEQPSLLEREQGSAAVPPPPPLPMAASSTTAPGLSAFPAGHRLQALETALVCAVALGSSILFSSFVFFGGTYGQMGEGSLRWVHSMLHEATAIALVWYLLSLRSKSFADLGLRWALRDVGWSIPVFILAVMAYWVLYAAIYQTGFVLGSYSAASDRVGRMLFGGGGFPVAILFALVNPFFEELIARAYVMTAVRRLTNSSAKAIMVSTLLQTSYHFYQGAPLAISEAGMFLVFSIYYAKTNRITPIILAHLYLDVLCTLQWTR